MYCVLVGGLAHGSTSHAAAGVTESSTMKCVRSVGVALALKMLRLSGSCVQLVPWTHHGPFIVGCALPFSSKASSSRSAGVLVFMPYATAMIGAPCGVRM